MPGRFVDEPYALVLIDDDHAGLHALYHVLRELLHIGEVDAALRGEGLALSRAPRELVREEGGEKKRRAQPARVRDDQQGAKSAADAAARIREQDDADDVDERLRVQL